jgi:dTDP-4-dehydrorhamnose reductase
MTALVTGATGFLGSALVTVLDYMTKVGLEDGMILTVEWYYKHSYLDDLSRSWRVVQ